jgi:flagellar hook-associated protein 1 FlgK
LPGPTGDPAGLLGLADALARSLPAPPGAAVSGPRTAATHAADLASALAGRSLAADRQNGHATGRLQALDEATAQAGIDTDAELQSLLLIERAYAANARVIRAADEMLQQLLRI